jgi:hypothetical protein
LQAIPHALNQQNEFGRTPLYYAASDHDLRTFELHLSMPEWTSQSRTVSHIPHYTKPRDSEKLNMLSFCSMRGPTSQLRMM